MEKTSKAVMQKLNDAVDQALVLCSSLSPVQELRAGAISTTTSSTTTTASTTLERPSVSTQRLVGEMFTHLRDMDLVKECLQQCPRSEDLLMVEDRDHYNLMHKAVLFGDLALLELLLEHGCEANGRSSSDACWNGLQRCSHTKLGVLHLASFLGRCDMVKVLLEHGADPSLQLRVYTSAAINDQQGLQPPRFSSLCVSRLDESLSKCGCREPLFYAILNNQMEVVKFLVGWQALQQHYAKHFVHLSCRVGALETFDYLLSQYPAAMNTTDTDGLPLLFMALNNDMDFVSLMLSRRCDVHALDDFHQQGANILHFIFCGVCTQPATSLPGLLRVTEQCLQLGAQVNAQRHPSKSTPLHDLVRSINSPTDLSTVSDYKSFPQCLEQLDLDLRSCFLKLLCYGADVNLLDADARTPLQELLSSDMVACRHKTSKDVWRPLEVREVLSKGAFGLDNVCYITEQLVAISSPDTLIPVIEDLVKVLPMSFTTTESSEWESLQAFELLREDCILEGYLSLLKLLLASGADPNAHLYTPLPPLLTLLSQFAEAVGEHSELMDVDKARRIGRILDVLVEGGADTEVRLHSSGDPVLGCFDLLRPVLKPTADMEMLVAMCEKLLHLGASTAVYNDLFYPSQLCPSTTITTTTSTSSGCVRAHRSFLHHLWLVTIGNVRYVEESVAFRRLLTMFSNHANHSLLHRVLSETQMLLRLHTKLMSEFKVATSVKSLFESHCGLRRLSAQCRVVICASLGRHFAEKVNRIPMPPTLRRYLISFEM